MCFAYWTWVDAQVTKLVFHVIIRELHLCDRLVCNNCHKSCRRESCWLTLKALCDAALCVWPLRRAKSWKHYGAWINQIKVLFALHLFLQVISQNNKKRPFRLMISTTLQANYMHSLREMNVCTCTGLYIYMRINETLKTTFQNLNFD